MIVVERASAEDLRAIYSIGKESFNNDTCSQWPPYLFLEVAFASMPDNFIVAKHDDEIIGFVILNPNYEINGRRVCELSWIAVREKYRGKGIGSILTKEALNYVSVKYPEVELIVAYTRIDNIPIHRILRKNGFEASKKYFIYLDIEIFSQWVRRVLGAQKDEKAVILSGKEALDKLLEWYDVLPRMIEFPEGLNTFTLSSKQMLKKFWFKLEPDGFYVIMDNKLEGFGMIQTFWQHLYYGRNAWILSLLASPNRKIVWFQILNASLNYMLSRGIKTVSFTIHNSLESLTELGLKQKEFHAFPVLFWCKRLRG